MTQKQLVLQVLRQAGAAGVTTGEFLAHPEIGHRFGGRIAELRDDGENIVTEQMARGSSRYTLKQLPVAPQQPQAAPLDDLVPPEAQGHVQPPLAPECQVCGATLVPHEEDAGVCDGCEGIQ